MRQKHLSETEAVRQGKKRRQTTQKRLCCESRGGVEGMERERKEGQGESGGRVSTNEECGR